MTIPYECHECDTMNELDFDLADVRESEHEGVSALLIEAEMFARKNLGLCSRCGLRLRPGAIYDLVEQEIQ